MPALQGYLITVYSALLMKQKLWFILLHIADYIIAFVHKIIVLTHPQRKQNIWFSQKRLVARRS